ncbi:MAG: hypothetical protein AMXMBFR61_26710 [Fimbriimonadales bacterium]
MIRGKQRLGMATALVLSSTLGLVTLFVAAGCSVSDLVSGSTDDAPPGSIVWNDPSPIPSRNVPDDATYVGVEVCAACHGRSAPGHPEGIYAEWKQMAHAKDPTKLGGSGTIDIFTRFISDGLVPNTPCAICHVTGAPDTPNNPGSDRGGFDTNKDARSAHNLKFWSVQCEACHGPGSAHVASGGNRNLINRIPDSKETCWKCHTGLPNTKGVTPEGPATDDLIALFSSSLARGHNAGIMIAGAGGYEYPGVEYKHSPHTRIANTCQTCHALATGSSRRWNHTSTLPKKEVCAKCHGGANNAADIEHVVVNSSGETVEDIQEHIADLLIQLGGSTSSGAPDNNANGGALRAYRDTYGQDAKYRRARWNYSLVINDGSLGVHNYDYAKQLLLSSLADLAAGP